MNDLTTIQIGPAEEEILLARQLIASLLADAFRDPRNRRPDSPCSDAELTSSAWTLLEESFPSLAQGDLGLGELPPERIEPAALGIWLEQDADTTERIYRTIFGFVVARDCPPYETEFCHWNDPTFRANQMADIAGFYQAFGLRPDDARPECVDHVSLQLDFVAELLRRIVYLKSHQDAEGTSEHLSVCSDALSAFLKDHLCWWAPTFAGCLERRIDELMRQGVIPGDLAAWRACREIARILRAWIAYERVQAGIDPVRQIISPQVAPLPAHDEESTCGMCDTEDCASSQAHTTTSAPSAQQGVIR